MNSTTSSNREKENFPGRRNSSIDEANLDHEVRKDFED